MQLALALGVVLAAAPSSAAPTSGSPATTSRSSQLPTLPASLVSLHLPSGPYTPAHFRWPMRFSVALDAQGRVTAVRELDGQRDIEAYVAAIRVARFKPARTRGVAVTSTFDLSVDIPDMHGRPREALTSPGTVASTPTQIPTPPQ